MTLVGYSPRVLTKIPGPKRAMWRADVWGHPSWVFFMRARRSIGNHGPEGFEMGIYEVVAYNAKHAVRHLDYQISKSYARLLTAYSTLTKVCYRDYDEYSFVNNDDELIWCAKMSYEDGYVDRLQKPFPGLTEQEAEESVRRAERNWLDEGTRAGAVISKRSGRFRPNLEM